VYSTFFLSFLSLPFSIDDTGDCISSEQPTSNNPTKENRTAKYFSTFIMKPPLLVYNTVDLSDAI
jgi:hypothetical protein